MKRRPAAKHHLPRLMGALLLLAALLTPLLLVKASQRPGDTATKPQATAQEQNPLTDTCTSRATWQPGTTKEYTITSGDMPRTFRVHLPGHFQTNVRYPVVIAFTGKGGQADVFEEAFGVTSLPAITVFPQATIGTDGATAWQGAPYSSGADDVAFVSRIIDTLDAQLCIKQKNIYSVGLSNGGGMSWLLSCHLADRIAAFAMIAGAFYDPDRICQPDRSPALLTIHGDTDPMVPYDGSAERDLPAIEAWVASRAKANRCAAQPQVTQLAERTVTTTWNDCANNSTVSHIRMLNTGHTWPNELSITQRGASTITEDTLTILWRFFAQHSL